MTIAGVLHTVKTITSAILPTIAVGVASTIAFAVVPTIDAIAVNRY